VILKVGATPGSQTHTQHHDGYDFPISEECRRFGFRSASHKGFCREDFASEKKICLPTVCQVKHFPRQEAAVHDHPPPFLASGVIDSLRCLLEGIQLRKH